MNEKNIAWIQAARLRTLPLSVSGIVLGSAVAAYHNSFDLLVFLGAFFTTIGLQVLSNFANDYGDGVKGTDNEHRIGPIRAIQSGIISPKEMKKAIIITVLLTFISALFLIYVAFRNTELGYSLLFLLFGILAIISAIKYTVGKSAYGYQGLGDLFVFLFFGLLSVMGTYFLHAKELYTPLWLPAISIGLLSAGVLNLNNMRDRESDAMSNKNTLVVYLGDKKSKKYHFVVIILAMLCLLIYTSLTTQALSHWLYIVSFAPLMKQLRFVKENNKPENLDPELKKLALTTFFLTLLFSLGLLI